MNEKIFSIMCCVLFICVLLWSGRMVLFVFNLTIIQEYLLYLLSYRERGQGGEGSRSKHSLLSLIRSIVINIV